jgi:hypothetical protein
VTLKFLITLAALSLSLASADGRVWAAGRDGAASFGANDEAGFALQQTLRIDNHWVALAN